MFVFLVIPVHPYWLKILRQILAITAATILFYQETGLPPFGRLIAQWDLVSSFSLAYTIELLGRFIAVEWIAGLIVAWILYMYLAKAIRMTVVAFIVIITAPLWSPSEVQPFDTGPVERMAGAPVAATRLIGTDLDSVLSEFYARENLFQLIAPRQVEPDFDILIVNVCSLSWQDLTQFNLLDHPFLTRSDITLTNFYTGSSYSGPATLRLLQSSCGHRPHSRIFEPEAVCLLGDQLADLGFSREIRLNHTGTFDNFLGQVQQLGGFGDATFVDPSNFPTTMQGFDQSPIYSDAAVLSDWLDTVDDNARLTFYNTTSLHDGNRLTGFRGNSIASYRTRLNNLLSDLNQLYDDIIASERQVLVVIVPEHGAGLQGDQFQLPGMREIPTPALTHVPVMMRLFGPDVNAQERSPIQVARSTGPTAVTSAIYQILEQRPFSGGVYDPVRIVQNLPETRPVLENDRVIMMQHEGQFYLQINYGEWRPYVQ